MTEEFLMSVAGFVILLLTASRRALWDSFGKLKLSLSQAVLWLRTALLS